ncbi:hypothetical protein FY152_17815 [Agrobacterium tumefaciens]|nr:hypothetical protein FY152_17815 [Agrobacterium tumefaciens]
MKTCVMIAVVALALSATPTFAQADKLPKKNCAPAADPAECATQASKIANDWKKANKGDYASQRNIAFCFKDGCGGAIETNFVSACAGRMIIQAADNNKDVADRWSFDADCKSLTNSDRRTALGEAEKLFKRIYGKQMPIERLLNN